MTFDLYALPQQISIHALREEGDRAASGIFFQ